MIRFALGVAVALLLVLASFPPAAAAVDIRIGIPLGERQGVTAVREKSGGLVFEFARKASRQYGWIAGREVQIVCREVERTVGGFKVTDERSRSVVRVPARGRRVPTGIRAHDRDVCELRKRLKDYGPAEPRFGGLWAWVPTTRDGRAYIDELKWAGTLTFFPVQTSTDDGIEGDTYTPPSAEDVVRESKGFAVALQSPDDTPPKHRVGYWTDGKAWSAVAVSAAGRRMFIRWGANYEAMSTNFLTYVALFLSIDQKPNDSIYTAFLIGQWDSPGWRR